jgi:hypothetical protein
MQIEKVEVSDNRNCYECRLGEKRLVITADFGPRIIRLSAGGGPNVLFVDEGKRMGRDDWLLYGGHRLWIGPETAGTYAPDNDPCRVESDGHGIIVTARDEALGLEKSITVCERGDDFLVTHTVVNRSDTLVVGAVWALTCITPKSTAFFPWGTGGDWDLKKIVYWKKWMNHATDVRGSQYVPTDDLFLIRPDGSEGKVGTSGHEGFIGATGDGFCFVKRFDRRPGAPYPDEDCAVQCYTCADFVELETLSPLTTFFPNAPVVHEEEWIIRDRAVDPQDGRAVRSLVYGR